MIDLKKLFNVFAEHTVAQFLPSDWDALLRVTRKLDLESSQEFQKARNVGLGTSNAAGKAYAFISNHFSDLGSTEAKRLAALNKGAPNLMGWAIYEAGENDRDDFCDFLDANWSLCPDDWHEGALQSETVRDRFASKASLTPAAPVQQNPKAQTSGTQGASRSPASLILPQPTALPPATQQGNQKTSRKSEEKRQVADVKPIITKPVFIIHGHDDTKKKELYDFLDNITNIKPIILHQQINRNETIVEKLVRVAEEAGYAVALLTADDVGRSAKTASANEKPRGRQNVVFEAGYFTALLGREKVAFLKDKNVEDIGDLSGVVYFSLASSDWRHALATELQDIGYVIDWPSLNR